MPQRFYPAVLERGPHDTYGVWFPDFPGCVAAARSQEEAMIKAQDILALAVEAMVEREAALPSPSRFDDVDIPKGCDFVTMVAVSVEPPDPSERVNVYLPKSVIARADRYAADFGMSRSSLFGLAVSTFINRDEPRALARAAVLASGPDRRANVRTKVAVKPARKAS